MAVAGVVCFSLRPILIKLAYGYVVDPVTLLADETLAPVQCAGAALVLAGVMLVTLRPAKTTIA